MAYLLLPAGAGTTRFRHPALADHYPDGDYPEVDERTVDGDDRRVIRVTADAADALADAGVGEVLPDDYFEDEGADDSDDTGDADADTADTADTDADDSDSDPDSDDSDDSDDDSDAE